MPLPPTSTSPTSTSRSTPPPGASAPLRTSGGGTIPPGTVPNHLVGAVLSTICCCMPFGVAAIIFAAQVNGKLAAGDLEGARDSSKKATTFMWISFGVGILTNLLAFAIQLLPAVAAALEE